MAESGSGSQSGKSTNVTKQQVLDQLKKEGVTDLDQFADFLVKKAHPGGDLNKPVANSVIIYHHGFVTS